MTPDPEFPSLSTDGDDVCVSTEKYGEFEELDTGRALVVEDGSPPPRARSPKIMPVQTAAAAVITGCAVMNIVLNSCYWTPVGSERKIGSQGPRKGRRGRKGTHDCPM